MTAEFHPTRRTVLGAALGGATALALPGGRAAAATTIWQPRWAPEASVAGLAAFETVEDDRANSHPAGQPHIYPEGNTFRFNMHMVDRDTMTDRQRQEVTGNRTGSGYLEWHQGETWRLTYQMLVPSALKATTTFTHIMQMKQPGNGTAPIIVQSLRRVNGAQTIELKVAAPNILVGRTSLDPLHDTWVDVDFQITIGDGSAGAVRWILSQAGTTIIDASKTGVDTFLADRVRPKWGIYRSLGDTSGSLQDCSLWLTNMRAFQLVSGTATDYQAESAHISQGVLETTHPGYTGTGYVDYDNVAGGYVEWTVNSATARTAVLTFRYANGTSTNRPMDIAVNGAVVVAGMPFNSTNSWNSWTTTFRSVPLRAGANTIRATATTANGGPNLDKITIS